MAGRGELSGKKGRAEWQEGLCREGRVPVTTRPAVRTTTLLPPHNPALPPAQAAKHCYRPQPPACLHAHKVCGDAQDEPLLATVVNLQRHLKPCQGVGRTASQAVGGTASATVSLGNHDRQVEKPAHASLQVAGAARNPSSATFVYCSCQPEAALSPHLRLVGSDFKDAGRHGRLAIALARGVGGQRVV